MVSAEGHGLTGAQADAVLGQLREAFPNMAVTTKAPATPVDPQDAFVASIEWLIGTLHHLQIAADLPVYERGRLVAIGQRQARFLLPTTESALLPLHHLLSTVLELMRLVSQDCSFDEHLPRLTETLAELKNAGASGLNIPKFIRAAFEMEMPFQALTGVYQYGHGMRARWLDSTFTDATPHIGATLARHKPLAARVMRAAGIPVPDHVVVTSLEGALTAAEKLGYPVVVKPADLDSGTGVTPGVLSADEVNAAYQAARRQSQAVLVEKHIAGRDYRIVVFQGEVVWAYERIPAGVTGDGQHSVEDLLARLNADPLRDDRRHAVFKRIDLDDEAALLLGRAGLTPSSVPAAGQFVRLRRIASLSTGGTAAPVFAQMHPDNRLLAERAVRALRLDLAGIDLLMPDIGRSWREVGAAINEVNGQPGFRQMDQTNLPARILRKLVPGDGRIPTVVVFGAAPTTPVARGIEDLLVRGRAVAGSHDTAGVRINGEVIMQGTVEPHAAGLALSVDRTLGAMVLSINDDSVLRTGLPFPRFDVLVLAGAHILPHCAAPETPNLNLVLNELLNMILPACDGTVLTVDRSGLALNGFEATSSAKWQHLPADAERFYAAVLDAMRTAEARHGKTWEQPSSAAKQPALVGQGTGMELTGP